MDYKKLYYKMFNATSDAITILKQAQIECEDIFLELGEKDDEKISQFTLIENKNTED